MCGGIGLLFLTNLRVIPLTIVTANAKNTVQKQIITSGGPESMNCPMSMKNNMHPAPKLK
jgi:hypothetical protein